MLFFGFPPAFMCCMTKVIKTLMPYLMLLLAVIFGTAANSFVNSADGFTKLFPSIFSSLSIILCLLCLSLTMRSQPIGITYAHFAGVCIVGTRLVGVVKFSQVPNFQTIVGLILIVFGVFIVNLFSGSDLPNG